jgi:hypothetical protein
VCGRLAVEQKDKELKEALEAKDREAETQGRELSEVKAALTQLQNEGSQSQTAKLGEATVEIAELRSKLHMERALLQKHREEKEELQKQVRWPPSL